jgi:hypothetical protein
MLKKAFLSVVLLVFIFLGSGCGTLSKGVCGLGQGLKDGAKADFAWLTKYDVWVKDNLW